MINIYMLCSEEKAKLLRSVAHKVEEKNQNLAVFLSSLQLEQLDLAESMVQNIMSQELVERCAALSVQPNVVADLVNAMQGIFLKKTYRPCNVYAF